MNLNDYDYKYQSSIIASYPLKNRDFSKLLIYKNSRIVDSKFQKLTKYLPNDTILFFNNTKVVKARIYLKKKSGAKIELLLIKVISNRSYQNYKTKYVNNIVYECLIGNNKKWKISDEINIIKKRIKIRIIKIDDNKVLFSWNKNIKWNEILNLIGLMPIPPYLKRKSKESDEKSYQTVYSKNEGAVAAPTAGLHFTKNTFKKINNKKINTDYFTLHVGIGTFKPIQNKNIIKHNMHYEDVIFTKKNLYNILSHKNITAVGTTSLRILESIYWFGVQLHNKKKNIEFNIKSLESYKKYKYVPNKEESIKKVIDYMNIKKLDKIEGKTSIFIFPGYKFMICDQLITNFHLPKSTLILLIASFIGDDWKKVYKFALNNNYRFFSYGDSSLLFKKQ